MSTSTPKYYIKIGNLFWLPTFLVAYEAKTVLYLDTLVAIPCTQPILQIDQQNDLSDSGLCKCATLPLCAPLALRSIPIRTSCQVIYRSSYSPVPDGAGFHGRQAIIPLHFRHPTTLIQPNYPFAFQPANCQRPFAHHLHFHHLQTEYR